MIFKRSIINNNYKTTKLIINAIQNRISITKTSSASLAAAPPSTQPASIATFTKRSSPIEPLLQQIRKYRINTVPSILQQSKIQPMQIKITPLSFEDITNISRASEIVRDILNELPNIIQPGVTTDVIDEFVHINHRTKCISRVLYIYISTNITISTNTNIYIICYKYTFYHFRLYGISKSCCTSVNEVVCHGIPDLRPLKMVI